MKTLYTWFMGNLHIKVKKNSHFGVDINVQLFLIRDLVKSLHQTLLKASALFPKSSSTCTKMSLGLGALNAVL